MKLITLFTLLLSLSTLATSINCKSVGSRASLDISLESAEGLTNSKSELTLTAQGMMTTLFEFETRLLNEGPDFLFQEDKNTIEVLLIEKTEVRPLVAKLTLKRCAETGELKPDGHIQIINRNLNQYLLDEYVLEDCQGTL